MKKQYLFSALAFSAFLASCSNEIETVTESVKQEAEMEEVVGADLVANGMTINVGGTESRAINGSWLATDQLALAWYNVGKSISDNQTEQAWKGKKTEDVKIYGNHKFTRNEEGGFVTESNVYQGGHFVYFPYKRESKVQQKKVKVNELAYTVKPENDPNPNVYEYDLFNKAFQLSAQDFIKTEDVNADGKLVKKFVMSQMVNAINVHANSAVEGDALKALEITRIEIKSKKKIFADEFSIVPASIPAVVRDNNGTIDEPETFAELDKYIAELQKTYKSSISRNVEPGFKLTEATNNLVLYTLPIAKTYAGAEDDLTILVSVKSEYGITGVFTIAVSEDETETNNTMLKTLAGRLKDRFMTIYREEGNWTPQNTAVELTNDNVEITWNIANKDQWNDAVALASDLGEDVTFTLTDEVVFTESINLPEGIKLTVEGNGSMVIDGDIEWPNTDDLDVTEANIVVEKDATLSINGEEGNRNTLVGILVNKGTIALNEYGTVGSESSNVTNTYGRVEVKYGSYVYADGGIVAFEVLTDTPAYQINYLITDDDTDADDGQALVNTLVINADNELNLNKTNDKETTYDPYHGEVTTIPAAELTDLSEIDIEMNGGKIYGKLGDVEEVNNVKVLSGTANSIVDVTIKGDLSVENDAKATVDATPNIYGKKQTVYVEGDIINGGTINADVDVITTDVMNEQPGKSKLYVSTEKTVWYTETYKQGGLAEGNVLKKSLVPSTPGADVTVVYNLTELNDALNADKNNIAFGANIEGNFILEQTEGNNIVIDGNGFMYTGTIYLYGNSRHTGAETITIKNVNFVANSDGDFINANSTDSDKRYAHNVTVENCTFTASGYDTVVGMRYRQCYNMTVKNCEATGLFSLMWATGSHNITVDNVNLEDCQEGGINLGTSKNCSVKNSVINVSEDGIYGVLADASEATTLTVENSEIAANIPVGLRYATAAYKLVLNGENTLTTYRTYQIVATTVNPIVNPTLTKATGTITITGAEGMSIF